jgi:prepilin-type N-terminal cleavage/methylation domain-containing protein
MKPPRRTTSSIGNNRAGFTFVEVMVTLVVLTGGIVFIYRTFFICVDYLSRLSLRLHASELIDTKIADISRLFRENRNVSFERGPMVVSEEVNRKHIEFHYRVQLVPVSGYEGMYRLEVGLSWLDAGRPAHFARSALLAL